MFERIPGTDEASYPRHGARVENNNSVPSKVVRMMGMLCLRKSEKLSKWLVVVNDSHQKMGNTKEL